METIPAYRSGWDSIYRVPVVKGSEKQKKSSNKSTPQKKRENKVYINNIINIEKLKWKI